MRIRETVLFLAFLATVAPAGLAKEVQFRKVVLDEVFRSEGVGLADINHDGKLDVLAGETAGEFIAHGFHQVGVDLVVEDAVNFEDAVAEVLPFGQDASF